MRLLLLQVPTSHLGAGERVYPLGLSRLAGALPLDHVQVEGLDLNLYGDPWPHLKEVLTDYRPDTVALSFRNLDPLAGHHASYLSALKTTAVVVRKLLPNTRIVAGGPAFSLFAERLMVEIPELDAGIVGEAENSFVRMLSGESDPGRIPGTVWRCGDHVQLNPLGEKIDLDRLPALNTRVFQPRKYIDGNKYVAAMGIEGKRGCNLDCAYCVYPYLGGKKTRLRHPNKIVDEMAYLHKAHGVSLFHFTDGVLNHPTDHFEEVCREMIRRKMGVGWTGFFREDTLTVELTLLAMAAGLVAIYFSGDALTDRGLTLLNKRLNVSDLLKAAKITSECNVLTMCHFLVNLPGEDKGQARKAEDTLDRLLDIHAARGNLGAVIFNNVRLYPNAPLTRRLLRNGELDSNLDFLYPVYFDPPQTAHRRYKLESRCHLAGVLSRLAISSSNEGNLS